MTREAIQLKTMECEDRVVLQFYFLLIESQDNRTIKWGTSEQSQSDRSDAQPHPMSSSEDNESKSYLELDESAWLVAQAMLPRVFEI